MTSDDRNSSPTSTSRRAFLRGLLATVAAPVVAPVVATCAAQPINLTIRGYDQPTVEMIRNFLLPDLYINGHVLIRHSAERPGRPIEIRENGEKIPPQWFDIFTSPDDGDVDLLTL